MMYIRNIFFVLIFISYNTNAQGVDSTATLPKGVPIIQVFTNYSGTSDGDPPQNEFDISRAYFGYKYTFNDHFNSEVIFDIAKSSEYEYSMILRNAYLRYHTDKYSISFGMIPTLQVMIHDEFWGYRYLLKSYQNEYGYGPSADLGVSILYKVKRFVYLDASIVNGNINKVPADSTLKYSLGATFFPSKKYKLRVYYDFANYNELQTISLFGGYNRKKLSIGMEWDYQFSHSYIKGNDVYGGSIFSTYTISPKLNLMSRVDYLHYRNNNGGKENQDETLYLVGLEHIFNQYIRISPNIRMTKHSNTGSYNASLFINLKFNI